MGILEIIGELIYPGPIGGIDFKDKKSEAQQKFIPIRFVISLTIIGIVEYLFLYQNDFYDDFSHVLTVNIVLVVYLMIASVIRIKQDHDNLGWMPFLVNNPFRFSDNINRFLLILNLLFLPGKYILRSVAGFYFYCRK